MYRILLRHTYVVIFLQLFSLIGSFHLIHMVPTGSDESKLRTFQGPFQDQISHYKDFYGEFHNANIPNTPHICGNFLLFSFWDITSDLIGYLFYILKESWQNVHFGIGCLLNW